MTVTVHSARRAADEPAAAAVAQGSTNDPYARFEWPPPEALERDVPVVRRGIS